MAKMLFVQEHEWQHLGVMYLSATLRKHGHGVSLLINPDIKELEEAVRIFKPDAVGFSIMTGGHQWAADMARQIKAKHDVKTIFGGPHVTFFPDFIKKEGVDVIVRGEGERSCLEFMDRLEKRESYLSIKNLWVKNGDEIIENDIADLEDIDAIAFPDRGIYDKYSDRIDMSVLNIITSRGCPYKCAFCFEEQQRRLYKGKGKYIRMRSHENVIAEIKSAISQGVKFEYIQFVDDFFGINIKWVYGFLEKYKAEIGRPFMCLIRPEIMSGNDDYARRLADAGCISIAFGVETGNERLRSMILNKSLSNEAIIKAATLLHDAGIKIKTYNLFGFPGETVEDSFSSVELNIKIKTDYPISNLFIPFPTTALTEYSISEGYLDKDFNVDDIRGDAFVHSMLKSRLNRFFERINKLFQTAVKIPAIWPFLKRYSLMARDIKIMDWFLSLWFGLVYFMIYWKSSKRNLPKLIFYGLKHYKRLLGLS